MSLSDSCSSLPSLSHSSTSTDSTCSICNPITTGNYQIPNPPSLRENEHLAISLPTDFWKPNSATTTCDNYFCGATFTLLNRRHHCRKCGGIFCNACTSRRTTLLNTASLHFIQPPRRVPIMEFDSPRSRVANLRVCHDCWDQVHGNPTTPFTPAVVQLSFQQLFSVPVSKLRQPLANFFVSPRPFPLSLPSMNFPMWLQNPLQSPSISPAASSTSASSIHSHSATSTGDSIQSPNESNDRPKQVTFALPPTPPPSTPRANFTLRGAASVPNLKNPNLSKINNTTKVQSRLQSHKAFTSHLSNSSIHLPEPSNDPLDAYPLRHPSVLCKAMGGGCWEPKPLPLRESYNPPFPGCKAQWELDEEEEERKEFERKYRPNPIVIDGPFKYRVPKEYENEPRWPVSRSPCRIEATY